MREMQKFMKKPFDSSNFYCNANLLVDKYFTRFANQKVGVTFAQNSHT